MKWNYHLTYLNIVIPTSGVVPHFDNLIAILLRKIDNTYVCEVLSFNIKKYACHPLLISKMEQFFFYFLKKSVHKQ